MTLSEQREAIERVMAQEPRHTPKVRYAEPDARYSPMNRKPLSWREWFFKTQRRSA